MKDPHDLFGLPLEHFVSERTALAKALRAAGEQDRAAEVAKLRKPSVAAWAVNQMVRTQQATVGELLVAGDRVHRAQSELLTGRGDTRALQDAAQRERAAADELTDTARGLLTSKGHELSSATLERVRETLHAAALDDDARAAVIAGCLERELRHIGLGDSGQPIAPSKRKRSKPKQAPDAQALRKQSADAQRAADRAERELRTAEQRHARAAKALQDAEATLAEARKRARQAAHAVKQAQKGLRS